MPGISFRRGISRLPQQFKPISPKVTEQTLNKPIASAISVINQAPEIRKETIFNEEPNPLKKFNIISIVNIITLGIEEIYQSLCCLVNKIKDLLINFINSFQKTTQSEGIEASQNANSTNTQKSKIDPHTVRPEDFFNLLKNKETTDEQVVAMLENFIANKEGALQKIKDHKIFMGHLKKDQRFARLAP